MLSTEKRGSAPNAEATVLSMDSWDRPFDAGTIVRLGALLPDFISGRRWYRAKARTIETLTIEDLIPIPEASSYVFVIRVEYGDSGCENYLLPLSVAQFRSDGDSASEADEIVGRLMARDDGEGILYGAFSNPDFRDVLLKVIACNLSFEGDQGELTASHTNVFQDKCGSSELKLKAFVSKAEQSNTSIVYEDRFIFKFFRKIEEGINPDIEIGSFLSEREFKHTPAVLGKLEYRKKNTGAVYAAAILQEFVRNQGDAWKYTLESLGGFFNRVLPGNERPITVESYHPLDLANGVAPARVRDLLGSYGDAARLLGTRTAQMHAALTVPDGPAEFAPEPFSSAYGEALCEELLGQADVIFELLRRKRGALSRDAAESAGEVLRRENRAAQCISSLRDYPVTAARIRFHGDFHLGQVLYTGTDFMIIDFEGEPARPLAERRTKALAMRDVAGMVRSFQYAAYAALFGQVPGVPMEPEMASTVESWAAFWNAWVSSIYLEAYFREAGELPFVPAKAEERRLLLDVFLLHKALYEVAYELNNRPDWVRIPLRGILSLVS